MRALLLAVIQITLFSGLAVANSVSPLVCDQPGSTSASPGDSSIHANSCTDFSYQYTNGAQPPSGTNNWLYGYYSGAVDPAGFTPMTQQVTDPNGAYLGFWAVSFDRYWTSLDAFGGHPNGDYTDYHTAPFCDAFLYDNCSPAGGLDPRPNSPDSADQLAVRRYVAPSGVGSTLVDINVLLQKDPRTTGPGAHGTVNYVIVYSGGVATTLLAIDVPVNTNPNIQGAPPTSDGIPQPIYSASLDDVTVKAGDYIDFVMSAENDPNFNNRTVDFSAGTFEDITIQSVQQSSIPEPATGVLSGVGLLWLWRRSQRA